MCALLAAVVLCLGAAAGGAPEQEDVPASWTATPAAKGYCTLPQHPAVHPDVIEINHAKFRSNNDSSRIEYETLPEEYKIRYNFSLGFKTVSEEGILFYAADERHVDSIMLYMKSGQLHYKFNCGSGAARLSTLGRYDDGEWHWVVFARQMKLGRLVVDEKETVKGETRGMTKTMNVNPPFYLGGIALDKSGLVYTAMEGVNKSFEGHIRDFRMNSKPMGTPSLSIGTAPCWEETERGIYFSADGGFIKARNVFRVNVNINIQLAIKPRNTTGLLMAVQSHHGHLTLAMINGVIVFNVDNGKGNITTSFDPRDEHYFCDGYWHTIRAVKVKNTIILTVDGATSHRIDETQRQSSVDTRHPLYIGGVPQHAPRRGLQTSEQYVGCMKDIYINDVMEAFTRRQAHGNVSVSFCPTT